MMDREQKIRDILNKLGLTFAMSDNGDEIIAAKVSGLVECVGNISALIDQEITASDKGWAVLVRQVLHDIDDGKADIKAIVNMLEARLKELQ